MIVCVLKIQYLCWMGSYVAIFCALEILTFGQFRRENAFQLKWDVKWPDAAL